MSDDFRGLVLRQDGDTVTAAIEQLHCEQLPPGDVLVQVAHSSLNYKDGMVLGGIGRLVRTYPHVGGIDFAGTVAASTDPRWPVGKKVILTGWRVGEMRWGGYAEYARVTGDMLVALPDGLTTRQAMAIGTAGFTSMLAILALEGLGIGPDAGDVLVTGASGGVGSVAATVLARLGYRVVASSGRPESAEYLRSLGVAEIVPRDVLAKPPARPLDSERWAGCVDAVGGATPGGERYPGDWQSAEAGEQLPIAKIPDGVRFHPGDDNVFAGKGQFYTLRYGAWLIGMNLTTDKTFALPPPAGFREARELVSGQTVKLDAPLPVAPRSTGILWLQKP